MAKVSFISEASASAWASKMKASYVIAGLALIFFTLAGVIIPAFRQMFEELDVKLTTLQHFVFKMNPVTGVAVEMALACITILKDKWCSPKASGKLNGLILFIMIGIGICIFLSLFMPATGIRLAGR